MRRILVRWLFSLILGRFVWDDKVDHERLSKWLAECYERQEFRDYFKIRDYSLLKTMAGGLDRETYLRQLGRREELLYLIGKAKEEWDKK